MDSPYLRLHAFDERTDGLQLEPVMLGEEPLDGLEQLIFLALEPAPGLAVALAPEPVLELGFQNSSSRVPFLLLRRLNPKEVRERVLQ